MTELLKVENISKSYVSGGSFGGGTKIEVLKNINFSFNYFTYFIVY